MSIRVLFPHAVDILTSPGSKFPDKTTAKVLVDHFHCAVLRVRNAHHGTTPAFMSTLPESANPGRPPDREPQTDMFRLRRNTNNSHDLMQP